MRDILNSTKGRTRSQKDYGIDAGNYVPLLERRPIPRGWIPSNNPTISADTTACFSQLQTPPTSGAYGRFGTLAQRQEMRAFWQTRCFRSNR